MRGADSSEPIMVGLLQWPDDACDRLPLLASWRRRLNDGRVDGKDSAFSQGRDVLEEEGPDVWAGDVGVHTRLAWLAAADLKAPGDDADDDVLFRTARAHQWGYPRQSEV